VDTLLNSASLLLSGFGHINLTKVSPGVLGLMLEDDAVVDICPPWGRPSPRAMGTLRTGLYKEGMLLLPQQDNGAVYPLPRAYRSDCIGIS
jgi:hypothetical protein